VWGIGGSHIDALPSSILLLSKKPGLIDCKVGDNPLKSDAPAPEVVTLRAIDGIREVVNVANSLYVPQV